MKRGSPIPPASRAIVRKRDADMCVRCFAHKMLEWHHRRTRNVVDLHQHCACNGVLLCHTCHTYLHANPEEARGHGLIVSSYEDQPFTVPYRQGLAGLWVQNLCDGTQQWVPAKRVQIGLTGTPGLLDIAG